MGDGLPLNLRTLDLEPYKRNPVVMFSHGIGGGMLNAPDSMPVGRSTDIRFDDRGRLLADFEFLPGDAFASRVKNAWDRGFLRAASVRATPARRKSGIGFDHTLREWSIVPVPKDVDAVRSIQRAQVEAILRDDDNHRGDDDMTDAERAKLVSEIGETVTRSLAEPPKGKPRNRTRKPSSPA